MAGRTQGGFSRVAHLAWAGAAIVALAGCETAGNGSDGGIGSAQGDRPGASRSVQIVERDVEAPEVFQLTDQALWDGRPSLGGVWVAHSEVTDPERVIIRNDETGDFVIGALFRRERENPGPRLQVSSDAASALGLLAGQPARLNVTALRRQEVEPPAPDPVAETEVAVAEAEAAPRTEAEDRVATAPGSAGASGTAGANWPSSTPAMIASATHSDRSRSKVPSPPPGVDTSAAAASCSLTAVPSLGWVMWWPRVGCGRSGRLVPSSMNDDTR